MSSDEEINGELMDILPEPSSSKKRKRYDADEGNEKLVPLKKRLTQKETAAPVVTDDKAEDESESEELEEVDEDGYYNEDDRIRLSSLPDLKREEILYERAEKRKDVIERKRIREEKRALAGGGRPTQEPKRSIPTRQKDKASTKKSSALDDLKARRQRSAKNQKVDAYEELDDESEEEEPVNPPELDEDYREDDEPEDEPQTDWKEPKPKSSLKQPLRHHDDRDSVEPAPVEKLTLDLLKPVIVPRSTIERWYGEPYWEKVIRGLFVRINLGTEKITNRRVYAIAEIVDLVEAVQTYKLVNKKECNQLATLKVGDKTKNYQLSFTSNDPPTEDEFKRWYRWLEKLHDTPPTAEDIAALKFQIEAADNYVYTNEDIEVQIKRNREKNLNPINFTKEKNRLEITIQAEKKNGNNQKVAELERQLQDLIEKEQQRHVEPQRKIDVSKINRKNELENYEQRNLARAIILSGQKEEKSDTGDPFARRKTATRFDWLPQTKKRAQADQAKEGGEVVEPPEKKVKVDEPVPTPTPKFNAFANLSIDFTERKEIPRPAPRQPSGGLLKPIDSGTKPTTGSSSTPTQTLSLSDYLRKKGLNSS